MIFLLAAAAPHPKPFADALVLYCMGTFFTLICMSPVKVAEGDFPLNFPALFKVLYDAKFTTRMHYNNKEYVYLSCHKVLR